MNGQANLSWVATARVAACMAIVLSGCAVPSSGPIAEVNGHYYVETASQLPLYTYVRDKPGVSKCIEDCLRYFQPVLATATTNGGRLSAFERSDKQYQLQFLGRPLYTSASDVPGREPRAHKLHAGWVLLTPSPSN